MTGPNHVLKKSYTAGGTITRYAIVMFGSSDDAVVVGTAATDLLIGVAMHDAVSGERVEVQLMGITEIKLGGTVTRGNDITSGAAGVGVALSAAATIKSSIGKALASGVTGDVIPVMISIWSAVTA